MEQLIEKYYKENNPRGKFFMYRVTFSFEEIGSILEYWIRSDKSLQVITQGKSPTNNDGNQEVEKNPEKTFKN